MWLRLKKFANYKVDKHAVIVFYFLSNGYLPRLFLFKFISNKFFLFYGLNMCKYKTKL